jgi:serine/threonine protein kinase
MATREDLRLVEAPEPGLEAGGDYPTGHLVPGPNVVVHRVLGRGGHATVYEAELPVIGKRVALKVLHPHLARDADMARRMVDEARTLAKLEHPNIVQVFNAGFTTDERAGAFILMELLHGISGRQLLEKKRRLPIANALEIAIDLTSGLEVAHRNGVIHLDLKPDNVFVHTSANRAVAKLYDFGIQRVFDPRSLAVGEQAPSFEGTPPYAAPEQLRGESVTPKTDLFAFGVLLFEFIAGVRPFHEEEARDENDVAAGGHAALPGGIQGSWLVEAQLNKPAPRLSSFLLVPKALEEIIAKCLEKDPANRPENVAELGAQLRLIRQRLDATFSRTAVTTQDLLLGTAKEVERGGDPSGASKHAPRPEPVSVAAPAEHDWRGGTVRIVAAETPERTNGGTGPGAGAVAAAAPPTPERRSRFGEPAARDTTRPTSGSTEALRKSGAPTTTVGGTLTQASEQSPPRRTRTPLVVAGALLVLAPLAVFALRGRGSVAETAHDRAPEPAAVASGAASGISTAVTALPPMEPMLPTASTSLAGTAPEAPAAAQVPPVLSAPKTVTSPTTGVAGNPDGAKKQAPRPSKTTTPKTDVPPSPGDTRLRTDFDAEEARPMTPAPKPKPKPTAAPALTVESF